MLEYENGQPKFLRGALVDKVEGLYGAGVLHFAGNTNHVDIAGVNEYLHELENSFGVPVPYVTTPRFYDPVPATV